MVRTIASILGGLIVAVSVVRVAEAQTVATGTSGSTTASPDALQTVVVTATHRSEDIKEVPASVSALSGADIQAEHIEGLEDIAHELPGVAFGSGGNPGMDTISMRGVSSFGGNATVGQYLDDVSIVTQSSFAPPSPTSGAAEPKMFDIDRVEVLRGPQGTLFGAGSMGGPNQFTASTTDDISYTAHGGMNYETSGVINVPLIDGTLALRAGVDAEWLSGYVDRYHQAPLTEADVLANDYQAVPTGLYQSDVNATRTLAARTALEWLPVDHLSVTASVFLQRFTADDSAIFDPALGLYAQDNLEAQPSTDSMVLPSLTVKYTMGWADLTSVSSYFSRNNSHVTDGTYFNSDFIQYLADTSADLGPCQCGVAFANLGSPSYSAERTQTTSQEIRLASKLPAESGIPLSWLAGIYASDRRIHTNEYDYIPGIRQTFLNLYGVPPQDTSFADPFTNDLAGWSQGEEDQSQIAAFGSATWYVLPSLRLTAGLRELRATTNFRWDTGGYFAQGIAPVTTGSNGYNAATPSFSISDDVTQDSTVYASASKGYRIGGYVPPIDLTTGTCPASLAQFGITNPKFSYGPDSLWSYEVGSKNVWLDNRLSVNGAIYYVDWKKVQQTFDLACGAAYTANFGNAESYGGELEIKAKPLPDWTVGLETGVTHATLTSVEPDVGATSGERLLNVPSYTATLNTAYYWPLANGSRLFVRGDYDWIGPSHGNYNINDPAYQYPSYTLLNVFGGYDFGKFSISLFAKNALNDQTIIQRVSIELLENAYVPRPRTLGIQFQAGL